jgi:hypothetical protein
VCRLDGAFHPMSVECTNLALDHFGTLCSKTLCFPHTTRYKDLKQRGMNLSPPMETDMNYPKISFVLGLVCLGLSPIANASDNSLRLGTPALGGNSCNNRETPLQFDSIWPIPWSYPLHGTISSTNTQSEMCTPNPGIS